MRMLMMKGIELGLAREDAATVEVDSAGTEEEEARAAPWS